MSSEHGRTTATRRRRRRHGGGNDSWAAVALAAATLVALVWANVGGSYDAFWSTELGVRLGDWGLSLSLATWVNDGLMALFFFVVGLDVRREFTLGELRESSRALLPVLAAVGGLVLPAVIFLALNHGSPAGAAWGAVISTDTAFALGMLALVGPKNAPRLRVFLLALAVVDDIGALTVIAAFYTRDLDVLALAAAAVGLGLIWLLQHLRLWRVTPYLVVGLATWLAMYLSGVHATLAGVLIALLMPVFPTRLQDVDAASHIVHLFRQAPVARAARLARRSIDRSVPMNQRLTDLLAPYVNYGVVPVFALSNAGVKLSGEMLSAALTSALTWGIVAGLVLGKLVGIAGTTAVVQRLVPASRTAGLDLPRLAGVGALSGMGFTISLLVIDLSLTDPRLQDEARVGVLLASALALLVAWAIFALGDRLRPLPIPAGTVLPRPVDVARDHVRGPEDAPATVVVYAALDPAYRTRTAEVLRETRERLGAQVRVVFRHHATAEADVVAALALEAAAAQGGFWPMHDAVVARPGRPDAHALRALAAGVGLDVERFVQDVRTAAQLGRVEDDNLDADAAQLPPRPVVFLDGRRLRGPVNSYRVVTELLWDLEQRAGATPGQP
ncbi:Na+/H+ antiporter NhaA [Georgenia thermotolerans]|uniref:Na(+)/H(+) antiporter NhaA n=1 Tax=Georgenia thermotolerans TaxID=527326 RepID=A0A7J5ULL5_9MICO|nr:Na+/H+ antiporter NhaA [Georgenia thermotolerans]KAE8762783.1 Na+/H+ antiporter NhaA [Georgenia thermotolerans]